MHNHDYQLVALDIDGTVLDSRGTVSCSFQTAIARLAEAGVHTVLCTGRRWRSAHPVQEQIPGGSPVVVCSAGALIKEAGTHRTLHSDPLSPGAVRLALRLFRENRMVPLALMDRPLGRPELLISRGDRSVADDLVYVRSNRDDLEWYDGPFPETEEPVLEIYTVADRDHVLSVEPEVDRQLKGLGRTTAIHQPVYGPRDWAFEVHDPTATKWNGLRHLMDRWKVQPEGIVAIGDDINDIPMLEAAGLSFAMGNAVDRVREVAGQRTTSNDEDGVVRALETVFPDLLA